MDLIGKIKKIDGPERLELRRNFIIRSVLLKWLYELLGYMLNGISRTTHPRMQGVEWLKRSFLKCGIGCKNRQKSSTTNINTKCFYRSNCWQEFSNEFRSREFASANVDSILRLRSSLRKLRIPLKQLWDRSSKNIIAKSHRNWTFRGIGIHLRCWRNARSVTVVCCSASE